MVIAGSETIGYIFEGGGVTESDLSVSFYTTYSIRTLKFVNCCYFQLEGLSKSQYTWLCKQL